MSERKQPARAGYASPPQLPKVSREQLATLCVDTELCPQVLLRVLGLLAARGLIPFTIAARRDEKIQRIEIEIDALPARESLVLLQNLRRIIMVRRAELKGAAERAQASAPLPAKL